MEMEQPARKEKEVRVVENFKSIHIDFDKGIFEVNGKRLECVSDLKLCYDSHNDNWTLQITKDIFYEGREVKNWRSN